MKGQSSLPLEGCRERQAALFAMPAGPFLTQRVPPWPALDAPGNSAKIAALEPQRDQNRA